MIRRVWCFFFYYLRIKKDENTPDIVWKRSLTLSWDYFQMCALYGASKAPEMALTSWIWLRTLIMKCFSLCLRIVLMQRRRFVEQIHICRHHANVFEYDVCKYEYAVLPFYWPSWQYSASEDKVKTPWILFIYYFYQIKLFWISKFLQNSFNFLERLKDTKCNVKLQLNVLGLDISIPTMMQIPA